MTAPRPTPPEEALATLLGLLAPVAPVRLPAEAALGQVLAEPVIAAAPVPDRPVALTEGWAVRAEETQGASPHGPVSLATPPARVRPGAALPTGCDAVLSPFGLEEGPLPQALETAAPGAGTRAIGEDVAPGTLLLAAGDRLGPRHLPALAALGRNEVAVRVPRLLIPDGGLLAGLARAEGAETGAATGAHLRILEGEAPEGFAPLHQGLAARPGSDIAIGRAGDLPALLVPALPEEAYAAWLLLLRPALRHLAGAAPPATRPARLARKVASTIGLTELVPLRLVDGLAHPLAAGAVPLVALAQADGVLVVPPGVEGYDAGAEIRVLPP